MILSPKRASGVAAGVVDAVAVRAEVEGALVADAAAAAVVAAADPLGEEVSTSSVNHRTMVQNKVTSRH